MAQEVSIRSARLDDAAVLTRLLDELGFPSTAAAVRARLDHLLKIGDAVLVATVTDTPVGLVTVHITPVLHRPTAVGRITTLVVDASMRRRGVGRALVHAAERFVMGRGCALIEVTSNLRLAEAHSFYERLGYDFTSRRFNKLLLS